MNARKMSKTKKPAKVEAPAKNAQAHKSAKRSAAAAEFDDEDEPSTSKRPKPGATSPGATKAASADKSKAAKAAGKAKDSAKASKAKAAGKATSPAKTKAASHARDEKSTTSSGKAKAAASKAATTSAGKAKAAATKAGATSAGKTKAATPGKPAGKGKGAEASAKSSSAKAAKSAAGKANAAAAAESKSARGAAKRKGKGAAEEELAAGEIVIEVDADALHELDDADTEVAAGTITEADDWLDAAEDEADSAARAERGEPLLSDISEIRGPREAAGATDLELAAGEVELGEDDLSADSQPAPTTRAHLKRVVESLIFVADQPVSANQLGRLVKAKAAEVREVVTEIMRDYDGRGIELVEVSGGFQFRSAAASAPFVRDLVSARPVRLTRAQLETLALIAYRQPITRPEIDDVRGVDSGSAIKVLLDRDLVKILGRKDEAGRPLLYGTAPQFLDFFGMNSLQDLPTLREFTELSEENRELFAKKMGEVPEDLSDPAFEPVVQHQEYDDDGNPITPAPESGEGVEAGTETPAGDDGEEGHVVAEDSELDIEAREARHEALSRDEEEADEDGETVATDTELDDEAGQAVDQTDDTDDDEDDDEADEDADEDDESDDDESDDEAEDADESGEAVDQVDDADEADEADDESDEDEDEDVDEDDESAEDDEDADEEEAEADDASGEAVDQVEDEADEAVDEAEDADEDADDDEESDADEEESDDAAPDADEDSDDDDDDDADEDEDEEDDR